MARCEIGMGVGGSHVVFRQCFNLVLSIEPDEDTVNTFKENNPDLPNTGVFCVGKSNEQHVLDVVNQHAPYDMIFVDGEHAYEGVKEDYEKYYPLVKQGGVIAFHDTKGDPRVRQFIEELSTIHEIHRIELGEVAGISYIKV